MKRDGIGRAFDLRGPGVDGRWPAATGLEAVLQAMENLLRTEPGERVMRPAIGAGLGRFLHQPNSVAVRARIAEAATAVLTAYEPRIVVDAVDCTADPSDPRHVQLDIRFRLRADGTTAALALAIPTAG